MRPLHVNVPPSNWATGLEDLDPRFVEMLKEFLPRFGTWQRVLVQAREEMLVKADNGDLPDYPIRHRSNWEVQLPPWCRDQRNQMTGPANDAALVVKMLNSSCPGVMIDLEDSQANTWAALMEGHWNALDAFQGTLEFTDWRDSKSVGIRKGHGLLWLRVRGLHLHQFGLGSVCGLGEDVAIPAALFDVLLHCWLIEEHAEDPDTVLFYIPKTEGYEEADWWRELFAAIEEALTWDKGTIQCMALVESLPMAYGCEEFARRMDGRCLGLNFGRWDYLASLLRFTESLIDWDLPDRNAIPHDADCLQAVRRRLVNVCHRHGMLAIGGMTALYPNRADAELNKRALDALERDKANEAAMGMDGAWTGHPDQNNIAVAQFPAPNQLEFLHDGEDEPDLRPAQDWKQVPTFEGTLASVRTAVLYRAGVLGGRGAVLLAGRMEDLATDRICRAELMRRIKHRTVLIKEDGSTNHMTPTLFGEMVQQVGAEFLRSEGKGVPGWMQPHVIAAAQMTKRLVLERQLDPQ